MPPLWPIFYYAGLACGVAFFACLLGAGACTLVLIFEAARSARTLGPGMASHHTMASQRGQLSERARRAEALMRRLHRLSDYCWRAGVAVVIVACIYAFVVRGRQPTPNPALQRTDSGGSVNP